METRARVVMGLLELVKASDGKIQSNVASAIGELGYPEFCAPLYHIIQETESHYLVEAYCRCASRAEKHVLIEFLESDNGSKVFCAAWAADRLGYTELIPILEKIPPSKRIKYNVAKFLDYLNDKAK